VNGVNGNGESKRSGQLSKFPSTFCLRLAEVEENGIIRWMRRGRSACSFQAVCL